MSDLSLPELVDVIGGSAWDVPEWQRTFVARPDFVARLADDLGLHGHCGNDDVSVFIEIEGKSASVSEFVRRLRTDAPPMAVKDGSLVGKS